MSVDNKYRPQSVWPVGGGISLHVFTINPSLFLSSLLDPSLFQHDDASEKSHFSWGIISHVRECLLVVVSRFPPSIQLFVVWILFFIVSSRDLIWRMVISQVQLLSSSSNRVTWSRRWVYFKSMASSKCIWLTSEWWHEVNEVLVVAFLPPTMIVLKTVMVRIPVTSIDHLLIHSLAVVRFHSRLITTSVVIMRPSESKVRSWVAKMRRKMTEPGFHHYHHNHHVPRSILHKMSLSSSSPSFL